MNILIVDDEALARSRLRTLLGDCQDTVRTTVAEAANTGEALAQLTPTGGRAFDLVLLDNCYHMITIDRERRTVIAKLNEFIARIASSAAPARGANG